MRYLSFIKSINLKKILLEISITVLMLFVILYLALAANIFPGAAILVLFPLVVLVLTVLPKEEVYPKEFLLKLIIIYFPLTIMWPYFVVVDLPSIDLHPSRVLLLIIVITWAYYFITCSSFRKGLVKFKAVNKWLIIFIWFYIFTQISGLPFSFAPSASMNGFFKHLTEVLIPAFMAMILINNRQAIENLVNLMIFVGVTVMLVGIWESFSQVAFWRTILPDFLIGSAEHIQKNMGDDWRDGEYRVKSLLGHPLAMVQFQLLVLPLFLYRILNTEKFSIKLLLTIGIVGSVYVLFESGSRSVIPALFAEILIILTILAIKVIYSKKGSFLSWLYVAIFPLLSLMGVFGLLIGRRAFLGATDAATLSTEARYEMWGLGWQKIQENPLAGIVGFGKGTSNDVVNWRGGQSIDSHHLTVLMDTGVLGLVSTLLIILVTCYYAYRHWLQSEMEDYLGVFLGVSLVGYSVVAFISSLNPVLHLFMLVVALVWILMLKISQGQAFEDR